MDENLRTIGDHLPLNIKYIGLPRPVTAQEGECWINPLNGDYSVWSTGNNLQPPSWNNYSAMAGLVAFCSADGELYVNDGDSWGKKGDSESIPDAFD
jgi:hypothetical protein